MSNIIKNGLLIAEILNGDLFLAKEVGLSLTANAKELLQDEPDPMRAATEKVLDEVEGLDPTDSKLVLQKVDLKTFENAFCENDEMREVAAEYFLEENNLEEIFLEVTKLDEAAQKRIGQLCAKFALGAAFE